MTEGSYNERLNPYGHDLKVLEATRETVRSFLKLLPDMPDLSSGLERLFKEILLQPPPEARERFDLIARACTDYGRLVGMRKRDAAAELEARTRLLGLLTVSDN